MASPKGTDIFISYQWASQKFALRLKEFLTKNDLNVWMDLTGLSAGDVIAGKLAVAISDATVFLACITKKYSESTMCCNEIHYAIEEKKYIIPVMLERLQLRDLSNGIGLLIAKNLRINAFKEDISTDIWNGPLGTQLLNAIFEKPQQHSLTSESGPKENPIPSRLKMTLTGHSCFVRTLALLPNGDLASGSSDKTIKFWNLIDGSVKRSIQAHDDWVLALIVLKNGNLVSASKDKTVKIWSSDGTKLIKCLTNHYKGVRALALLQNGDFASGSEDKTIRIWSEDGVCKKSLVGHTGTVFRLVVLPSGDLASASGDKSVRIWSVDGVVKQCLWGHSKEVWALTVLKNGDLASGSEDSTIKIWSCEGSLKKSICVSEKPIFCLNVLANGDLVSASGWMRSRIKIADTNGRVKATFSDHGSNFTMTFISDLLVLPNGELASASAIKLTIKIWAP